MRHLFRTFLVLLTVISLSGLFVYTSSAESSGENPNWINSTISVTKLKDYTWADGDQYHYGNTPCANVEGYSWHTVSSGWSSSNQKSLSNTCATTGMSAYFGDKTVMPFNSQYWQQLDANDLYDSVAFMNPGTDGMAVIQPAYLDYNHPHQLYYVKNVFDTFNTLSKDGSGNVVRSMSKSYDKNLAYPDGRQIGVNLSGIAYSANGRWMYVNTLGAGQLRLNTEDFSAFSFANDFTVGYGVYSAISNSGNTIATYAFDKGLKLYDLTRCEDEKPDFGSRNCASRDITDYAVDELKKLVPDSSKLGWPTTYKEVKFLSESEIRLLVSYVYDGQAKYAFLSLKVPTTEPPASYLALGDSFSSGEGTFNYNPLTNFYNSDQEYNLCHTSPVSYPYILGRSVEANWLGSVACSGAVSNEVVSLGISDTSFMSSDLARAKVSIRPSDENVLQVLRDSLPGYVSQNSMVKYRSPTIATITIGGNDIGFGNIIAMCITQASCFSNRDEREQKADDIASKILSMSAKFRALRESMGGSNQRLYVLGYPSVVNFANNACSLIGQGERERLDALEDYLNESIKIAAHNAGAIYINLAGVFAKSPEEDHRLCGNSNLAINGFVTASNARNHQSIVKSNQIFGAESYHPNVLGHNLIASELQVLTNDLKFNPVLSNNQQIKPDDSFYARFVGDNEDYINEGASYDFMTQYENAQRGNSLDVRMKQSSGILPSVTGQAVFELHSDPVILKTINFNPSVDTNTTVTIPANTTPGWHELHLKYVDIEGKNVDLYQYIYVTASAEDYDGDGILNSDEACQIGGTLGRDSDNDGIDDACDSDTTILTVDSHSANTSERNIMKPSIAKSPNQTVMSIIEANQEELALPYRDLMSVQQKSSNSPQTEIKSQQRSSNSNPWPWIILTFSISVMVTILLLLRRRS